MWPRARRYHMSSLWRGYSQCVQQISDKLAGLGRLGRVDSGWRAGIGAMGRTHGGLGGIRNFPYGRAPWVDDRCWLRKAWVKSNDRNAIIP
jgi:hypothetical protein